MAVAMRGTAFKKPGERSASKTDTNTSASERGDERVRSKRQKQEGVMNKVVGAQDKENGGIPLLRALNVVDANNTKKEAGVKTRTISRRVLGELSQAEIQARSPSQGDRETNNSPNQHTITIHSVEVDAVAPRSLFRAARNARHSPRGDVQTTTSVSASDAPSRRTTALPMRASMPATQRQRSLR